MIVGDLSKLIVAKGFKKLPKVRKIAQYGHTGNKKNDSPVLLFGRNCFYSIDHSIYFYFYLLVKVSSVTRLGDFLHFEQIFQAFGNNKFAQISQIFVKVSKSIIFLVKSFWATFPDIWRFLSGHTESK